MRERLPSPFDVDQRPVAAIFRSPLFNLSETFVRAQAAGLVRYQPLVLGLRDKGNVPSDLANRVRLKGRGAFRPFADRLKAYRPVVLHAHFGPDGLRALPLAERLAIPLVTTLHGYDASRSDWALLRSGRLSWMRYAVLKRRLQRGGALFIAVSEAVRRRAIARGYPADRTITHYIGVDLKRHAPAGGEKGETVLFVGRLVEKKGVDILLRAFAGVRARRPSASLSIIGDGPRRRSLERLAGRLGVGGVVTFLGEQPPEVVVHHMRRASVLAVPSVTARDGDAEGLPTVIVEAAACALPAVGTDHAGIPEAIADGKSGFVVPERDPAALAARLSAVLESRDLRDRMGAAARALAIQRFDGDRQMRRLEEIYDAVRVGRCG